MDAAGTGRLEISALLHDVGKMSISDAILNKRGNLTAEEWETIKTHPKLGADIARRIPQLSGCVDGILHHHEWWDGTGYPDGLKGEEITLDARILAIADAFAAMISERSYTETLTRERALEEIKRCAGKQFDPHLVEKFVNIHEVPAAGARKKARR
ncbi:MAG: hypothetical protein A2137_05505 [Chloroflexi bacterium RBG_16_58_8]|nr:MAG: hypothetical protein A2137_05505 [Chloroflexi bacterium RBG_16_58_8]